MFKKEKLEVRKLVERDIQIVSKWLSNPAVLEFYEGRDHPFDLKKVREKFLKRTDGVIPCIVEYEKKEIGYIQFYKLDDKSKVEYGYADTGKVIYGTDQFIGEVEFWNKGIGALLVSSMVDYLVNQKKADIVVMDPQAWNERAIKCYEKCDFKKVKLLPKNEWHEGAFRDCWLMEFRI